MGAAVGNVAGAGATVALYAARGASAATAAEALAGTGTVQGAT